MLHKFFTCLIVSLGIFVVESRAQQTPPLLPEDDRLVYSKEIGGGVDIHSRGWGALFRYSRLTSGFKKITFESELVKMKHPKEIKVVNPYFEDAKSYVYGKKNSFFVLRTGLGSQTLIFDRAPKDGVEINFVYTGGFAAGFTKPIYLDILVETNTQYVYQLKSEKYNEEEHFPNNIYGYSGFTKGFDELKFHPGIYLKTGLNFDWASQDDVIKSLEVGALFDAYTHQIPIMAPFENLKNKQTFLCFYANVILGKKY
jgi:hypothetical protein